MTDSHHEHDIAWTGGKVRIPRREYWDAVHSGTLSRRPGSSRRSRLRTHLRRWVGEGRIEAVRSYNGYVLWNVLYPCMLPRAAGLKVLEVGSAPGNHALKFAQRFGYDPYGVEYSEPGVELNRRVFADGGVSADHVLHRDFFSDDFLLEYAGHFDVVVSNGFIEHFPDPARVTARHVELLAPGGVLVLSIPHLRGINHRLMMFFNCEVVALHNLEIMTLDRFAGLFSGLPLQPLYCDYFGAFDFGLFNTRPDDLRRFLLAACLRVQRAFNFVYYLLLRRRIVHSRWFSPYLFYIGTRSGGPARSLS